MPQQLDRDSIQSHIAKLIADHGAEGMKDMGKIMGLANKSLAGQADGKTISEVVKELLS